MSPSDFDWSDNEIALLKKLTEKYKLVKELFLYAEEIDNKVTFLPASNEFRSAFDHLMRVYAFKFGFVSSDNADYPYTNIDKSFGHIYRAGYDSLDFIQIKLTKHILDTMDSYSNSTIIAICPEYYRTIKPNLKSYAKEIAIIRSNKDIGNVNEVDFDKYIEFVNKIKSYDEAVTKIECSLAEYENKRKKEKYIQYFLGIVSGIVIMIGGYWLTTSFPG